ncbi:unnamed protein product, partial [Cylicostephanus goldi]
VFDLNDPESLAAFAGSDDDEFSRLGEIPRGHDLSKIRVKRVQAVKLPVFDLNDPESLAAFAGSDDDEFSRANSTDSNIMARDDGLQPLELGSPTSKKKTGSRLGFAKAKKNLKALFGKKDGDANEEDETEPPTSNELNPPPTVVEEHHLKVSRLHRQETCAMCSRHLTGFISQAYKCSSQMQNVLSQGMLFLRKVSSLRAIVTAEVPNEG